jgi:hypothetical protein
MGCPGVEGARSCGDEHDVALEETLLAGIAGNMHGSVGPQPRRAADELDAVALDVAAHRLGHRPDDLVGTTPELRHGRVRVERETHAVDLTPAEAGDVQGSLPQGLGRDPRGADGRAAR